MNTHHNPADPTNGAAGATGLVTVDQVRRATPGAGIVALVKALPYHLVHDIEGHLLVLCETATNRPLSAWNAEWARGLVQHLASFPCDGTVTMVTFYGSLTLSGATLVALLVLLERGAELLDAQCAGATAVREDYPWHAATTTSLSRPNRAARRARSRRQP